jgi:hypothetical protein
VVMMLMSPVIIGIMSTFMRTNLVTSKSVIESQVQSIEATP